MDKQRKEYKSVKLDKSLVEALEQLKHPGQSFNGVILELIAGKGKK